MRDISRRHLIQIASIGAVTGVAAGATGSKPESDVRRWEFFEIALNGPRDGNPFHDAQLTATFSLGERKVKVDGFYDGDGIYKIRFMPDTEGAWRYTVNSNKTELNGRTGVFLCSPAASGVHGPVTTSGYHFVHADGTSYFPFGTTCYAWIHQSEAMQRATIASLAKSPFNKIRMCVFPKHYEYNHNEPSLYPFERNAAGNSDFTRPNPVFYRHLETQIAALRDLHIEADLILFHPYDHWGYATMTPEEDDCYVRYVVARLAAYRNVWWSMANEYDLMKAKTTADFDRLFRIVAQSDPASHLRSIHQGNILYNHAHPWVTHASVQGDFFDRAPEFFQSWRKPVVFDEVQYEGNLNIGWGNLSGQELVYRFWRGVLSGGYVSHGETILSERDAFDEQATPPLWWAHGGKLRGLSPARIGFLRQLLEECMPAGRQLGLVPIPNYYYPRASVPRPDGGTSAEFYFFDDHQPIWYEFPLPEGSFTAEHIDPWAMTRTAIGGTFRGKTKLKLTGKPYQAILFRRV